MSEAIVVALITGGMSLAGVVFTCIATAKKTERSMEVSQAVMKTEIKELTREVRENKCNISLLLREKGDRVSGG